MMIKPEKAIEIVKSYLDNKKISYTRISDRVRTEKGVVPYGVMEGKELTTHTVCYDYESYDDDAHVFITVNAEDGTLLFGASSTSFLDITG